MDKIASLYTMANGKFACKKCNYRSNRYDNLKRHIKEKHMKIKVSCECGKKMTKSALSRHQRMTCSIRSKQSNLTPATIVAIEERTVSFNIQLIKLSDGTITIKHDAINVDGHLFNLVQSKEGEKNLVENG